MNKLLIRGDTPLAGEIHVSGSKNAALPILAATLLSDNTITLAKVPHLNDVTTMIELLSTMGVTTTIDEKARLHLNASKVHTCHAARELVRTMRASILTLGPLLGRYGHAEVALPGGCAIGARPIDLHTKALEAMGAEITLKNGYIFAKSKGRLKGATIVFETNTVTGTENTLMAAVLAEGKTVLKNAACEPEISDLAYFLTRMGAKIRGIGTDTMTIEGVDKLSGGSYEILSDRIEAGTYLTAAALTRGRITLREAHPEHLSSILTKLQLAGAEVIVDKNIIHLDMHGKRPKSVNISTAPYPGFPTDMQAQFMALNIVAEGGSTITETIFENRFMHVKEMLRMGADITLKGNTAICSGMEELIGTSVKATDLRASASLVLAGLAAKGETIIENSTHIDRGYEYLEEKLTQLGADIQRIN